jgi:hypothetical protein
MIHSGESMRKPVIAAVIAGTIGFGGLVATAGIAQAAAPATASHPAPRAKKPHHHGTKTVVAKPKPKKKAGKTVKGMHKG